MFIADLHIHSRFSRATSRDCDAPHLDYWARMKGISLIGTGDFTHPQWREELRAALEPAEEGLYRLRDELRIPCRVAGEEISPRFVISGEISTIYKKGDKTRKVHHVILLPSLEAAEDLSHRLEAIGNLHSDGRPILGLDSHDLLEIVLDSCPQAVYIPAHIWTPHFSLFGAFSGFDSLEECYGDLSTYVHALETGLSSDPLMNRRLSALDDHLLVSNSDAHSPAKLGREANMLDCEMSYPALKRALDTGDGFAGTIEFFPEEGKYHLDGHRACDCCLEPEETIRLGGRCPVCGRKLTIGVYHRVEELADRPQPVLEGCKPFESLMPLPELLADCLGASPSSKKVQAAYFDLLERFGPEFHILRNLPPEALESQLGFAGAEALRRLRAGRVLRKPGYDGEYGVISLFAPGELELLGGQMSMLSLLGEAGAAKKAPKRKTAAVPQPEKSPASAPEKAPSLPSNALNPAQQAAVGADAPVVAVIAGPGTGKTKTLVARIAHLVSDLAVAPERITAVTFTNQAAAEMRARLESELGKKAARRLTVGTFHAIALGLLPEKPVASNAQQLAAAQTAIAAHKKLAPAAVSIKPAELVALVSARKNGLSAGNFLPDALFSAYNETLHALNVRDLDDILLDALDTPADFPQFDHLLVDEFQDINAVQHRLVRHWAAGRNLFVIGDPDQSIYGFRGANANCFDALLASHPGAQMIALTENYRSSPAILESALTAISRNPGPARILHANRPETVPVRVIRAEDELSEGVWIAQEIARMAGGVDMLDAQAAGGDRAAVRSFSEIAVLCRTRRQLEKIEMCLRHDSIPCVITGRDGALADGKVQALLSFFRALADPRDTASLRMALTGLFACPESLADRVASAFAAIDAPDLAALAPELEAHAPLRPWLEAAQELLPKLEKDKPRKLLERLIKLTGIKTKPVERLLSMSVFHDTMQNFLAAIASGEETDLRRASGAQYASGAVRLMTLHGAKGLEFPAVFLAGLSAGELPLEREGRETDVEEERRLFFVGLTRAREELILTHSGEPSPFLEELPASVQRENIRPRAAAQGVQLSMF